MTREEAIQEFQNVKDLIRQDGKDWFDERDLEIIDMAIEALQAEYEDYEHATLVDIKEPLKVAVVRCKDCRYAGECHKSVQYTRNEPRTVTMGYAPIDFCSHGERREPEKCE